MVSSVLTSGSAFFLFVFVLLIVAEESIGKRKDQEKKKERGKKGKSASATVTNVSGVSNQPREPLWLLRACFSPRVRPCGGSQIKMGGRKGTQPGGTRWEKSKDSESQKRFERGRKKRKSLLFLLLSSLTFRRLSSDADGQGARRPAARARGRGAAADGLAGSSGSGGRDGTHHCRLLIGKKERRKKQSLCSALFLGGRVPLLLEETRKMKTMGRRRSKASLISEEPHALSNREKRAVVFF